MYVSMASSRFVPTIKYRPAAKPVEEDLSAALANLDLTIRSPATVSSGEIPATEILGAEKKPTEVTTEAKTGATPKDTTIHTSTSSPNTAPAFSIEVTPSTPPSEPLPPPEPFSSKITIDPSDEERIIVTLTNGTRYGADRYCPHNGADLAHIGEVMEDEYGPEIGPILLCPLHYWEYALDRSGISGGGWATVNACRLEAREECKGESESCKVNDW
ncbi:hypothetical protein BC937DRAFT_90551 [Endogone sp. FLAS-F59071]|nr:hypothetical protein BC937DRAFT_90551 [Endogone sp. FLAS-F59071]|eukprot:RUS22054.1 hypothetical protein BC937DRAFT_90551 [Endogone sp. FLAS-F59071]